MGCLDWYLKGEVDWHWLNSKLRDWSPLLAGALFGAGWWCWVDAVVYSRVVLGETFPFVYHLPGWVATLALIMMNLVSRDDLAALSDNYGEEGSENRARLWLFVSYITAFGAVAGSAAVLISCVNHHAHVAVGVGSLLQSGFILASALLLWAFRTSDDSDYGFIG